MWKYIHPWGSPQYFYQKASKIIPVTNILTWLLLLAGIFTGLFVAPIDYQQKDAFRIIYVHVPSAMLSMSIYTMLGISSIIYLIWRIKLADVIAKVSAPLGAGFTAIALLTGSIWGKPMWGTWWVWDARLTSELILLFLYFGYMGLRSAIEDPAVAAKVCAILAIVGLIDIPIIHFSVQWWETLHQGATITKFAKPSMTFDMLYPLLIMLAGFYLFFATTLLLAARNELLWRERKSSWVRDIVKEQIC